MNKKWRLALFLCCMSAECFRRNLPNCSVNDDDCAAYGMGSCVARADSSEFGVCQVLGAGDGGSSGGGDMGTGTCTLVSTLPGPLDATPVQFGSALALQADGGLVVGDPQASFGGQSVAFVYPDARVNSQSRPLVGTNALAERFGQSAAVLPGLNFVAAGAASSASSAVFRYQGTNINGGVVPLTGAPAGAITAAELAAVQLSASISLLAVGLPDADGVWAGTASGALAKLTPAVPISKLGTAVAMNAKFIVASDGGVNVQIFTSTGAGTAWSTGTSLPAPAGAMKFGTRLALSGDELLVSGCATGNTCRDDIYRFRYTGAQWTQAGNVLFSKSGAGSAIALSGKLAVAGSPNLSGKAWAFSIDDPQRWVELRPGTLDTTAAFGTAVAVAGNLVAVGAPGDTGGGRVFVFSCSF